MWYQNRPQLQTGQFPLTQRVSSQLPRFNQLRDGQKLPKTVYGESVLTQIAKIKITGSIIGPVGKKIKIKKFKITGSIIGPAMAGPTGPSATALN